MNEELNKIKYNYNWEVELKNGTVITKENNFNPKDVARVSFVPTILLLPRHDVIFLNADFKYKKRFCRAMMNWGSILKEYLHCVRTDKFSFYVRSTTGQAILTCADYELYY